MFTQLLEKLKRPGLLGLIGMRADKRCRAQLLTYFTALGHRVAALELQNLAEPDAIPELSRIGFHVEIVKHTVQMKLANVLRTFTPLLKGILENNIHDAMLASNRIHHFAEADDNEGEGDDPTFGGKINSGFSMTSEEASLYASVRAGELVTGINTTTQKIIADAIEEGITERLGVDGTKRLLLATIKDMTANRARLIASTEMNDAFSEATMRKLNRMGVSYKQWITSADACDFCVENEDAGPIPIGELFPSGDERPPGHPFCRCAVSGARPPVAA